MKAVLISTYELGRQPFGLASPAAWLRSGGVETTCIDLSQEKLDENSVRAADLIAIYLPMHTATRIAIRIIERVTALNPSAHLCAYGLYAPLNEEFLRKIGVDTILGGEFEQGLLNLALRLYKNGQRKPSSLQVEPIISLTKQKFLVPDRTSLPVLGKYSCLIMPDGIRKIVGYTEATRGCKHLCRHCPIVPVYNGQFRVIQRDIVLEDIRQQVSQGAQHITFGDPDFFNGIKHAVEIVHAVHDEFPHITYDVVIKVEHMLKHAEHLGTLKETGCAFITSAIESIDDKVLMLLDKRHTRADFIKVVGMCREVGLALAPTFVAFTPWITLEGYEELLETLASLRLIEHVSPIQLAIRLLIPSGSKLLELPEVREIIIDFDESALNYKWAHADPRVDALQLDIEGLVRRVSASGGDRRSIFNQVWLLLKKAMKRPPILLPQANPYYQRSAIPYMNEPWYC